MPATNQADYSRKRERDVLELDGDCSSADIEDALAHLSFGNIPRLVSIDREVRDFLLTALRRR
jgi:hypothetical protein